MVAAPAPEEATETLMPLNSDRLEASPMLCFFNKALTEEEGEPVMETLFAVGAEAEEELPTRRTPPGWPSCSSPLVAISLSLSLTSDRVREDAAGCGGGDGITWRKG